MATQLSTRSAFLPAGALICLLWGCAGVSPERLATHTAAPLASASDAEQVKLLDRVTWGINATTLASVRAQGIDIWLEQQLKPGPVRLPATVEARINALTVVQKPLGQLLQELEQRRRDAAALHNDEENRVARQAYQGELTRLAIEAAQRTLLRALYSPNQLQEQMVWFWMNHFNVHQNKANIRAMIGDYEERAIRPHALGKFRDLLRSTTRHPAMLRYLDNERNAVNRVNENYARELMELHTLGIKGGYSQRDVQELARVLTGVGINLGPTTTRVRPALQADHVRDGPFEFNPNRHDYGPKQLLGQALHAQGLAELDEALDRLARHPATARFISRKLATHFVSDEPSAELVERLAQTFIATDGDIAATLRTLFAAPELRQALGGKFKDPMHYVVSAIRLAYDGQIIANTRPLLFWLSRLGQPLYGRETPDGYPLAGNAWTSPGQMTARFEVAKAIGSGAPALFRTDDILQGRSRADVPAPFAASPADAFFRTTLQHAMSATTRAALSQSASPVEWNTFLLSSPEMMKR